MTTYDDAYYEVLSRHSREMAERVVPLIINLLHPASVLDVGCGEGAWLAEFMRCGVRDVQGLDGEWVNPEHLLIPRDCFRAHDIAAPWPISRTYELALCLEVAEHLPEDRADHVVQQLVKAAPAVLFSAAIPYQDGTHHINCQWPSYWAEKFKANGFMTLDPFRLRLWNDPGVIACYAQNILLYVREGAGHPWSRELLQFEVDVPLSLVHPKLYMRAASMLSAIRAEQVLVRKNWRIFWNSVVQRVRRFARPRC